MSTLNDQIKVLSTEVSQLGEEIRQSQETIRVLETKPEWEPQNNGVLTYMRGLLQAEADEKSRQARLKQFNEAIARSEKVLAAKEDELKNLQQREVETRTKIFDTAKKLSEEVEAHIEAIEGAVNQIFELEKEHGSEVPVFGKRGYDIKQFSNICPYIDVRSGRVSVCPREWLKNEIQRENLKRLYAEQSQQELPQPEPQAIA
jgi:DNA repair exonuclease SbcCD ATPase subunit